MYIVWVYIFMFSYLLFYFCIFQCNAIGTELFSQQYDAIQPLVFTVIQFALFMYDPR